MSKWKMVKLGDVCEIARGGSPRPIEKFITESPEGINWIKIGDTTENNMYITQTKQKIIPEGMKKSRYVQSGDFLLSNSMSFGRPYILKIDGCIHDGWLVLRDKNNFFESKYLYYVLSSKAIYRKFQFLAVGGVVNNLNSDIVRQVEIPLPPIEVQQKIANTLDTASELLAMRKQQLQELDNLIQSTFYDMFGDPVTNEKGWEVKKLGVVCHLKAGKFISAKDIFDFSEDRYPCYGGNGIRGYVNVHTHEGVLPLIGRQGALCGNVQLAKGKFYATEHAVVTAPTMDINTIWLYHILVFMNLNRFATGAAQPGINVGTLNELSIPLPPLSLQNKFAEIVTKIEEQKELVQKAIDETQYLFDSLMSEYFE